MSKYKFICDLGIFITAIGLVVAFVYLIIKTENIKDKQKEQEAVVIVWRHSHLDLNAKNLYKELLSQEIDYPEIVQAQAILETGHFKSNACTQKNNLFGLRKRDGGYMSFSHWTDAVAAYKKYIQKYDTIPNDYYIYLQELGYAEDPEYITKVKQIVKQ